jgi:hypothetical protein
MTDDAAGAPLEAEALDVRTADRSTPLGQPDAPTLDLKALREGGRDPKTGRWMPGAMAGDGAASYAIVSVHETTFAGPSGSNDSVAVGAFHYGRIPDHLSGEKPYTPWWSGMLNERSADYWRR